MLGATPESSAMKTHVMAGMPETMVFTVRVTNTRHTLSTSWAFSEAQSHSFNSFTAHLSLVLTQLLISYSMFITIFFKIGK